MTTTAPKVITIPAKPEFTQTQVVQDRKSVV